MSELSSHTASVVSDEKVTRSVRCMVLAVFAAILALRVLFVIHYRIDSDEPQHLHVVWGWTHHLVQYRDLFDNHTPLFHLACTPLLLLVGERADALIFMRFAMVPLFFFSLWCVWRLGVIIKSAEVGLWAAVFAALSPAFCFTFTEFRTDDLWTAFWLWSLVVLLGGPPTAKRGFVTGLLFGAAVATSLKTLALLGCLAVAAIVGLVLAGTFKTALTDRKSGPFLAALLAGCALIPGLLLLWFAKQHALHDALFGIFTYNSVPGLGRIRLLRDFIIGLLQLLGTIALLIPFSAWMARRLIAPQNHLRFHLVFLGSGFYGALIYTLWPLLDAEHFIPFHPLMVLGFMPLLIDTLARPPRLRPVTLRHALLAAVAFAVMAWEATFVRLNAALGDINHYADLLRLSNPSDYIMDLKGETTFLQRPYRFLFEGVGVVRAKKDLMPDTVPEDMIRTRTCIALRHNWRFIFPRAIAFMDENYISVGAYRVLGHPMTAAAENHGYTFHVVIPQTFAFVTAGNVVRGTIDGQPCQGFATLTEGTHEFLPARPKTQVDFVWKQAIDRGFFPVAQKLAPPPRPLSKSRNHSA